MLRKTDNEPASFTPVTQWEKKIKDFNLSLDDGASRFRNEVWKKVFDDQLDTTPLQTLRDTFTHRLPTFSLPIGEDKVSWTVWLTEEAVWERYHTLSQISIMKGEELEKTKNMIFDAMKGDDVERNAKGEVALHGVTFFAWTSRV